MPGKSVRLGLALLGAVAGCYTQIPVEMTVPQPESRIVARLTDVGSVGLAPSIGAGATNIEGIVASASDSSWDIRLTRVDYRGGVSNTWNRELVTFPRSALTNASEKRLDKKKSWIVAGAVAVGAFLLERFVTGGFASGDEGKGNTEPPAP